MAVAGLVALGLLLPLVAEGDIEFGQGGDEQEEVTDPEPSPEVETGRRAQLCTAARNVRSSWKAGDAEAAAEDARELTEAANELSGEAVREQAETIRSTMANWRNGERDPDRMPVRPDDDWAAIVELKKMLRGC